MIRELVNLGLRQMIAPAASAETLDSLAGFVPNASVAGMAHDQVLYGRRR